MGNALLVGPDFSGMLTALGGTITSGSGTVGSTEESSVAAIVTLQGSTASWTMPGQLTVRGHNMAKVLAVGGATLSTGSAQVASVASTTATIQLADSSSQWNNSGSVYLGGNETVAGGSGTLEITSSAFMSVNNTLKVWDDFEVTVTDSMLQAGSLEVVGIVQTTGAGMLFMEGCSISVTGGGTLDAYVLGNNDTHVTLQGAESSWSTTGGLTVATATSGNGHMGTLTLGPGTSVTATGTTEVLDNSELVLGGGTITAPDIHLADNDFVGFGTLEGDVKAGGSVIASGNLVMGNPASYTGVQIDGSLVVGAHTVTLNKAGFFKIGILTDISGGTLIVPGGVAIPVGNSLVAFGAIDGRVVAQSGSVIEATGPLSLGDAESLAGFFSDGEMLVHQHAVTIHDANEAVLGSLTELGSGAGDGTLNAENGLLVEFGKNVAGHGTINTPNDPSAPLMNNGTILGDSSKENILLTGYVKGVGTFDNFTCSGTFSPGLSPISLSVGSMSLTPGATLLMEIGGTTRGDDYDALISDDAVTLDGTLEVVLTGGFTPAMGDTFDLFDFTATTGQFDDILLPDLDPGLQWYDSQLETTGLLLVTTNGDIDKDGDVDSADLNLLLSGFKHPLSTLDQANLNALLDNFGRMDTGGETVPEPAAIVLLCMGSFLLIGRRRCEARFVPGDMQ